MVILLSAYSCGPCRGSEPAVGWNAAMALAQHAEVHVLTTHEFRELIETEITVGRVPTSVHFHFFDLPGASLWWKYGRCRGIQFHYALWQRFAGRIVRKLHRKFRFDAAQHVTFVRYWVPSCLRNSGIPYVFGPVGGADTPPRELVQGYSVGRRVKEFFRHVAHWVGENDPATRRTLIGASHVFAATPRTLSRCLELGVRPSHASLCQAIALSEGELNRLANLKRPDSPVFITLGRLDPLKGYDLALQAFATASIPNSRLLLIGGGPDEARLRGLARALGIEDKMTITGFLPREKALSFLAVGSVLLHPSHLDSGGFAVLEAMAAGRPIICLDLGGPSLLVDEQCGFKIQVTHQAKIIADMAAAMRSLSKPDLVEAMGAVCSRRAGELFRWISRGEFYARRLKEVSQNGTD